MMSMYVMKSPGQFSEHIKSKTSKKQKTSGAESADGCFGIILKQK